MSCIRDETMIEIHHPGKLLESFDSCRTCEHPDGFYLRRQWNSSLTCDPVAQVADGSCSKFAFAHVDH